MTELIQPQSTRSFGWLGKSWQAEFQGLVKETVGEQRRKTGGKNLPLCRNSVIIMHFLTMRNTFPRPQDDGVDVICFILFFFPPAGAVWGSEWVYDPTTASPTPSTNSPRPLQIHSGYHCKITLLINRHDLGWQPYFIAFVRTESWVSLHLLFCF